ncbi:MAG: hypothetical protein ACQEXN_02580 [Actinomycetota bacterium]
MGARPRYIVTSIRVAAGSFLTATAVATVVVMGSAPASAATASLSSVQPPARAVGAAPLLQRDTEDFERQSGQGLTDATGGGANRPGGDRTSAGGASAETNKLLGAGAVSRLEGIRQEMDQAVQLHLVTAEQADRFVNQMQERILRGL